MYTPVSYTHLDVYKRQVQNNITFYNRTPYYYIPIRYNIQYTVEQVYSSVLFKGNIEMTWQNICTMKIEKQEISLNKIITNQFYKKFIHQKL